jgi:hypothetical protein
MKTETDVLLKLEREIREYEKLARHYQKLARQAARRHRDICYPPARALSGIIEVWKGE